MKKTLQSVFQLGFDDYLKSHKIPLHYYTAARSIMSCRTAVLGGHKQYCKNHHLTGIWYNSCKHRSCPQCQGFTQFRWLENQKEKLLNCPHAHLVFTIPHEYLDYWRYNSDIMTALLFSCVKECLNDLLRNDPQKKYLDAQAGFIMTLHTSGRDLSLHPHIHCIITDGGLTDTGNWVTPKRSVILPARVLMAKFRGKFNAFMREQAKQDNWIYPSGENYQQLVNLTHKLGRKKWNVYIKEHFKYAGKLLKYLVNYLKGGVLKNAQITNINQNNVTFRYYPHKQNPDGKKENSCTRTLTHTQLIDRYLQHIPKPGTTTVRHYGIYSNGNRAKLNQAREHLKQELILPATERKKLSWRDYLAQIPNAIGHTLCKQCQQSINIFKVLPRLSREQLLQMAHAPP